MMMTLQSGTAARTSPSMSRPSSCGMRISSSRISGRTRSTSALPLSPSIAVPAMTQPREAQSMVWVRERTVMGLSSMMATFVSIASFILFLVGLITRMNHHPLYQNPAQLPTENLYLKLMILCIEFSVFLLNVPRNVDNFMEVCYIERRIKSKAI